MRSGWSSPARAFPTRHRRLHVVGPGLHELPVAQHLRAHRAACPAPTAGSRRAAFRWIKGTKRHIGDRSGFVIFDLRLAVYTPNGARLGVLPHPLSGETGWPLNDVPSPRVRHNSHALGIGLLGQPCAGRSGPQVPPPVLRMVDRVGRDEGAGGGVAGGQVFRGPGASSAAWSTPAAAKTSARGINSCPWARAFRSRLRCVPAGRCGRARARDRRGPRRWPWPSPRRSRRGPGRDRLRPRSPRRSCGSPGCDRRAGPGGGRVAVHHEREHGGLAQARGVVEAEDRLRPRRQPLRPSIRVHVARGSAPRGAVLSGWR